MATNMDPTELVIGSSNDVGLWVAPVGTALPLDITTAFATPWLPLGYADGANGVKVAATATVDRIIPWQSKLPIRTMVTERSRTMNFIMWQLNQVTLGVYFDMSVPPPSTGGALDFDIASDAPQVEHAICVDVADGANALRVSFPRCTLDVTGDMLITKSAPVPLDVTLTALDHNGVMAHVTVAAGPGTFSAFTIPSNGQPSITKPAEEAA